jgi:hypothetical protein
MGKMRKGYKILAGIPAEKRQLGRPSHRLQGDIKMDLRDTGFGKMIGFVWLKIVGGGGLW